MDGERRLRRAREGRLITGVCAGLGRYTRIDPVVFRVGFALLVLTTGVGLVLYAGAFLLMAEPDGRPSKIEQVGRRRFDGDTVLAILGLALAVGMLLGVLSTWTSGKGLAVAVVFALALFVAHSRGVDLVRLVRSLPERVRGRPPATQPPQRVTEGMVDLARLAEHPPVPDRTMPTPPVPGPMPSPHVPDDRTVPLPPSPAPRTVPMRPAEQDATRPLFDDLPGVVVATETYGSRGRRRSYLTPLTLAAAGLAGGALFVWADGRGGWLDRSQIAIGGAVAVIVAGLFLGTWFGRNRGLVIVGVIMSFALASASLAADPAVAAKAHSLTWEPAAAVPAEQSHRVLVGEGTVDLTRVPLAPGQRLRVSAQVTLGVLTVRVPAAARVEVDARALLGDVTVDRQVTSGPAAKVRRVLESEGGDGGAAPVIELRIRSKVGDMEVRRVPG